MTFRDIRHALGPQPDSLESLGLDCDPCRDWYSKVFGPMTLSISFNALKAFMTATLFLIPGADKIERHSLANMFPPSLQTFHLTRFRAGFESLLDASEHLLAQSLFSRFVVEKCHPGRDRLF